MYLNCHSFFSLRYGTISIELLIETAIALNVKTLALTDINTTSGAFDFVKLCQKNDIKPVVGVEFRNDDELLYVCIAKNVNGFSEINAFASTYKLTEKQFPSKTPEFENVIVMYPLSRKSEVSANNLIGVSISDVSQLWKYQHDLSKFVLLQPVTFLNKQGFNCHRLLRAIDKNCLLSKLQKTAEAKETELFYSPEFLKSTLSDFPTIIQNTNAILEQCDFEFDFHPIKNRQVFTTSKEDDLQLLKKIAYDGVIYRYGKHDKLARERVEKELKIIAELNFGAYFLITWDIIKYARSRGYFHVGRGSGANSIVAYCIGITDVDPISLDLYFERFINPHRTSPPDFDVDFSWDERDEIIDYVFKRYGSQYVCLLATYVTFRERSAFRELGKVFGLPKSEIDELANPRSQIDISKLGEWGHLIVKYGKLIEDFPNYLSIHAGGILISEIPLSYYTALNPMPKGFPICEFDMYVAEDIGFAKFDVLSQRGLGHIKEAVDIVFKNQRINVDIHAIQAFKDDPKIKAQVKAHETMGCFYIESPAMRQLIWKLRCEDYITLVAASSIIRPGVASSGMMKAYIERHHDPSKAFYIHPKMKDLLQETYGVMVYQEDVIKVAHHFAGLTLAESDVLRRAMSGKYRSRAEFQKIVDKFFLNCKEFGYDDVAKEVWRQIESFSGYSFSKAHSASYAVESYQSLYLKTYFPLEFMVAVINNFGGFYRTEFYIHEARRCGAIIEAPDINQSNYLTRIEGNTIWLGWVHIKSLEKKVIEWILKQREQSLFTSFDDFCRKVPAGLEQITLLIRVGSFRNLGYQKKELLWEAHAKQNTKRVFTISNDLFELEDVHYEFPVLKSSRIEDAYDELEILGFTLQNPFSLLYNPPKVFFRASDLSLFIGKQVAILGYLVTLKPTRTKKGERMFFGYFTDIFGEFFDTVHFPKSCEKFPFKGSGIYHIKGKVMEEFSHCSIQVTWMEKLPILADPRME
ncbi:DNA polymerase III subunit alpha [Arcicella rosea]|uniref:DNA-directed DNA polymerase n=1 Tax=Arcicella rosea TaxID=502909 RepID=A0A841EKU9_9BACT|nr:DNA polymerase III subunit alpha [Arcicella rosea]MBB6003825.1 DNA polymerase-3 subunit alpha [Arcicella rosea]